MSALTTSFLFGVFKYKQGNIIKQNSSTKYFTGKMKYFNYLWAHRILAGQSRHLQQLMAYILWITEIWWFPWLQRVEAAHLREKVKCRKRSLKQGASRISGGNNWKEDSNSRMSWEAGRRMMVSSSSEQEAVTVPEVEGQTWKYSILIWSRKL